MSKFVAAVVQASTVAADTTATVEKTIRLIEECGQRGAKVAVFPEAFIGGYPKGADFGISIGRRTMEGREEFRAYFEHAIDVPGPETRAIAQAARDAGTFVTIGVIERDGGTLYCTVLFFSPEGELLGKHRKLMPTAAERLCWGFGDGSTLTAVPTPWGNMGAVICWENYMPLLRTAMYSKNLAIYCAPTADDRDTWVPTMQHVALEGRCFVLSACQYLTRDQFPDVFQNRITDDAGEVLMRGGSVIVDPYGKVLAGPDFAGECILTAELNTKDLARSKIDFDVVGHYARPDVFQLTVEDRAMRAVRSASEEQ
jgi:nitrilase